MPRRIFYARVLFRGRRFLYSPKNTFYARSAIFECTFHHGIFDLHRSDSWGEEINKSCCENDVDV